MKDIITFEAILYFIILLSIAIVAIRCGRKREYLKDSNDKIYDNKLNDMT